MAGDRNATAPNVWTCNGNHNAPTFHPSLLIRCGNKKVCHSWIQHGQWVFLGDCTHALRNQTVPMRNEEGVGGE